METHNHNQLKQSEKGAWLSIATFLSLAAIKLTIGITFHSEALRADGLNNTTDVFAAIAILVGLKIAQKPPDSDHPYGHFRAETIASLIASFIIFAVGLQVLIEGMRSIFSPKEAAPHMIAAWVALASALILYLVYRYNIKLSKRLNNHALRAVAADNKADAYVSLGAFVGIFASQFRLGWIDTVTALIVGLIICKTGWDIFRHTVHSLTDGFSEKKIKAFKRTIEQIEHVKSVQTLRARYSGSSVYADVVIKVDSDLNVKESHTIADNIEQLMTDKFHIVHTHVHIEPDDREE